MRKISSPLPLPAYTPLLSFQREKEEPNQACGRINKSPESFPSKFSDKVQVTLAYNSCKYRWTKKWIPASRQTLQMDDYLHYCLIEAFRILQTDGQLQPASPVYSDFNTSNLWSSLKETQTPALLCITSPFQISSHLQILLRSTSTTAKRFCKNFQYIYWR